MRPFWAGKAFDGSIKESTPRVFGDDDRKRGGRLEGGETGHRIERVDQEGRIPWWHNIIQPMHTYGDILHIDGNDSAVAIPDLDGHHVGVEENSDIPCSIQEIEPREARVQAGEDVYAGIRNLAQGTDHLDIRRERGRPVRWRIFGTASEVTRSRRKFGKEATAQTYWGSGRMQPFSTDSVPSDGLTFHELGTLECLEVRQTW